MLLPELLQYNDVGLFALRIAVAIIFIYHALPKLQKPEAMAKGMGWSTTQVWALGLIELTGGLGLFLGIFIQLSALALAADMVGAIYYKAEKWKIGFMAHDKTGWEFDLILLAACIAILLTGGGSILQLL